MSSKLRWLFVDVFHPQDLEGRHEQNLQHRQ